MCEELEGRHGGNGGIDHFFGRWYISFYDKKWALAAFVLQIVGSLHPQIQFD